MWPLLLEGGVVRWGWISGTYEFNLSKTGPRGGLHPGLIPMGMECLVNKYELGDQNNENFAISHPK